MRRSITFAPRYDGMALQVAPVAHHRWSVSTDAILERCCFLPPRIIAGQSFGTNGFLPALSPILHIGMLVLQPAHPSLFIHHSYQCITSPHPWKPAIYYHLSPCPCCNIRIGVLLARVAREGDYCTINKKRISELLFTAREISVSTARLKRRKGCWNDYGNVSLWCLMMLICPSDEVGVFDGNRGEKRGGSQWTLDSFHRGIINNY
jgi:hypothetical protein